MRKIITLSFTVLFMVTSIKHISAQTWQGVGSPGFTAHALYTSITVDRNGTPYVAYCDSSNGGKATVMKYVNNSWTKLGSGTVSPGRAGFTNIVVDANTAPYVVYEDVSRSNAEFIVVKKLVGSTWEQLGANLPSDSYGVPSIALNKQGVPYIGYYHGHVSVMMYSSGHWQAVGDLSTAVSSTPGASASPTLALDVNGKPYISYSGTGNHVFVESFANNAWSQTGNIGNFGVTLPAATITIDNNNVPWIVRWQGSPFYVEKFTNGSWTTVGGALTLGDANPYISLAVYNGNPYILSTMLNPRQYHGNVKATVTILKNGSWVNAGSASGFSAGGAYYGRITVNSAGQPYVVYEDYDHGFGATVMTYR
jgi:hypothetical protein